MKANQISSSVRSMARVLGPSKAGVYAWSWRAPFARHLANGALLARMQDVHAASRGVYGAPRAHAALGAQGEHRGRKRIARLMRQADPSGCSRGKGGLTTTRRGERTRSAPDLVDPDTEASAPDQLRIADITCVTVPGGFLHLAVALDAFSPKIVGWWMRNHLRSLSIIEVLRMVIGRRPRDVMVRSRDEIDRNTDALADVRRSDVPHLLVWGGSDPSLRVWVADRLECQARNASPHVLEAGRRLQVDEPADVARIMLADS